DEAAVDRALDAAAAAFRRWSTTPVAERGERLRALAAVLRHDVDAHAAAITLEMGKTLREARAEVEKCAFVCEYVADNAARFLADEPAPSDSPRSLVTYEPLGTVLACMPWNFPYWQVFRCAALAVGAGNCVVLKHANNVTRCGFNIESAFREAGFPESVFTMLVLPVDRVAGVIADARIAAVSLTGSTGAGRSVGAAAGEHLKRCVLELGGSDAFIVLDDADLDEAASVAARARFQNAGQSCIAAKRFIVVDAVADAFVERFVARTREITIGDPTDDATQMGPLARRDLAESIERQLRDTLAGGARLRCGGQRPAGRGFFFEPTVVDRCDVDSVAFQEETFGPLAAVMTVRDEDGAVRVANASRFGLGGNVWTRDIDRGRRVARALETGGVFINGMTHSDPRIPFGGVKESGYGRELHRVGMHEFVNVKTVWMPPLAETHTASTAR
ncbi:MAG: NAD-dependent succinate-semialdehyde dehydrogenase, partial [Candidatus Dormibacteraeota bacterium]|nr:NAD-dependent succinate-semialdehyde dehydrogenase [Candidatus Dormibacteraeota bacterium]